MYSTYVANSVHMLPLQYICCHYNTYVAHSVHMLPIQYICCQFSTYVANSVHRQPLQYICCQFSTQVANSVHMQPLQYSTVLSAIKAYANSILDASSRQHNLFGYHTGDRGDLNCQPRCWEVRTLTTWPSSQVTVQCGNIPDTLVPEIYVIMAIPIKSPIFL